MMQSYGWNLQQLQYSWNNNCEFCKCHNSQPYLQGGGSVPASGYWYCSELSLSSQVAVGQTTRRQVLTKHPCLVPTATVHLRHVLSLCKCSGCSWCKVTVIGRVVVGIAQGQSSTSCSAFCRRRQARPRNKPWAPEWRVVHIYEQICVTCDGWNIKVLVFWLCNGFTV